MLLFSVRRNQITLLFTLKYAFEFNLYNKKVYEYEEKVIHLQNKTRLKMKTTLSKPVFAASTPSKTGGAVSKVSKSVIKLKAVTEDDRQRLRIPSYQYLIP